MKSPTKGCPRLSNAQRNLLQGRMPAHRPETMQALHRRCLVAGIDHRPTPAGVAIFAPPAPPA